MKIRYEDLKKGPIKCVMHFSKSENSEGIVAISDDSKAFFLHNNRIRTGGSDESLMKKYPEYSRSWYLHDICPGETIDYFQLDVIAEVSSLDEKEIIDLKFKNRTKLEL